MTLAEFIAIAPTKRVDLLRVSVNGKAPTTAHAIYSANDVDPEFAASAIMTKATSECVGVAREFIVIAYGDEPRQMTLYIDAQPEPLPEQQEQPPPEEP
jgi:hypothetical protein